MDEEERHNFDVFRDCLFAVVIQILATDGSKSKQRVPRKKRDSRERTPGSSTNDTSSVNETNEPAELAEFADYLSSEAFDSLPANLRTLTYRVFQADASLSEMYSLPLSLNKIEDLTAVLPPSVPDTLVTYGLFRPPSSDLQSFMSPIFSTYINTVTTAPLKWIDTRTGACEICERDWVPTTYHHLIPKKVHVKVLRRGWHEEHQLNSVAWLCRACHSFVHRMASNEELAREWYTVDKIREREDIQKWTQWVARVRWKKT